MMGIVLTNAMIVDIDPPSVEPGSLRIEGDRIVARGASVASGVDDEIVDCRGAMVLPGLVNGHTHLYSALAVGMPPPPRTPRNFHEILQLVWWRLDRALDAESIEMSAMVGAMEAVRCGTTTLIDHHASPNEIAGALDLVESGIASAGIRGVLCYETTDRHGVDGRKAGIEENRRYLARCRARNNGRFAGLVGAHASFTLDDEALIELRDLADEFDTGVHIHVAEDPCDEADARARCIAAAKSPSVSKTVSGGAFDESSESDDAVLVDRLDRHGLLRSKSIFAHGTHLSPSEIRRVSAIGTTVAHNARSNMNNSVGYAPVDQFECPVMLGTDGIGADMLAEAKAAWLIGRHQRSTLKPNDFLHMLGNSARRASSALGVTLGQLAPGAAADVVVTDYVPAAPLMSENLAGHFLFGLSSKCVSGVLCGGQWVLRDRGLVKLDEARCRARAVKAARELWARMGGIPV